MAKTELRIASYKEQADQGNKEAQLNLGLRYEYGEGVEPDPEQAVSWYRRAAAKRTYL